MIRINWLIAGSTLFLAACQSGTGAGTYSKDGPETIVIMASDPTEDQPDKCWTKEAIVALAAPKDGSEQPAHRDIWFEVPCADDMTPDFATTLQRALKSRGLYDGAVDGLMGGGTRKAVHQYQSAHGLDSDVLSMDTARQLGLIAYPRPDSE